MNRLVIIAKEKNEKDGTPIFKTTLNFAQRLQSKLPPFAIKIERLHDVRFEVSFILDFTKNQPEAKLEQAENAFFDAYYKDTNTNTDMSVLRKRLHRYFNLETEGTFQTIILFIMLRIYQFFGIDVEKVWIDRKVIPGAEHTSCPIPTDWDNLPTNHKEIKLPEPSVIEGIRSTVGSSTSSSPSTTPLGSGIVIAVLDAGMNINHPGLAPPLLKTFGTTNQLGIDCVTNYADNVTHTINFTGTDILLNPPRTPSAPLNGHGMGVAGVIAHINASLKSNAQILNVKTVTNSSSGMTNFVRGINACAQLTSTSQLAQIINISYVFYSMLFIDRIFFSGVDQIEYASVERGCIIVFSAGNQNPKGREFYSKLPSNAPSRCIIVAGTDQNYRLRASSNYGTGITIAAPAYSVCSLNTANSITTFNGTSSAAPHIAAIIGIMLSLKPTLTLAEIKTKLATGGHSLTLPAHVSSDYGGFLAVNVEAVLNSL